MTSETYIFGNTDIHSVWITTTALTKHKSLDHSKQNFMSANLLNVQQDK